MSSHPGIAAPKAPLSGTLPRLEFPAGKMGGLSLAAFGVVAIALGAVLAAASEVGPVATAFWRMALTVPACLVLLTCRPGGLQPGRVVTPLASKHVWIAAIAFASVLTLWYSGQRLSSVATTSTLHNLSPVFVMLCVWLRYGDRPRLTALSGLALAVSGAGVLALHSYSLSHRALSGDVLALLSALALAVYYVCLTRLCRRASAFEAMLLISLVAAPLLWVAASLEAGPIAPASVQGWVTLIALALVAQIVGQAALAAASRTLGAFGTSAAALGEPAVAAALAALVLAAPIFAVQAAGISAVAVGIWMCQRRPGTAPTATA